MDFLKSKAKLYYKDRPETIKSFCNAVQDYTELSRKKGKKRNELMVEISAKKFIDAMEKHVVDDVELRAKRNGILDIMPFAPGRENVINVQNLTDDDPLNNINLINESLTSGEDFFIFDSNAMEAAKHTELNSAAADKNRLLSGSATPCFLWEEIFSMNLLLDLKPEHFKLIRENLLAGTAALRSTLLQAKRILLRTPFLKENMDVFIDLLGEVKWQAAGFKKVEKENELLNNLTASGTPVRKLKIMIAVTSYGNLIIMLKEMRILSERESLYVQNTVSDCIDLSVSIPFFIAKEI